MSLIQKKRRDAAPAIGLSLACGLGVLLVVACLLALPRGMRGEAARLFLPLAMGKPGIPGTLPAPSETLPVGPSSTPTPSLTPGTPSATPCVNCTPTPTHTPYGGLSGKIAFPRLPGPSIWIYEFAPDAPILRLLAQGGSSPAWSPDGSRLAFVGAGLEIINADGSGRHALTQAANDSHPAWSPDGATVAFNAPSASDPTKQVVYLIDAGGANRRQLLNRPSLGPAWSPDGSELAYGGDILCENHRDVCGHSIEVARADLTRVRILTTPLFAEARNPAWSPTGNKIAFGGKLQGRWGIYVINADGSGLVRLTDQPGIEDEPTWSPDGRTIAFVTERAGLNAFAIWVMNADGSNQRPLPGLPAGSTFRDPAWMR